MMQAANTANSTLDLPHESDWINEGGSEIEPFDPYTIYPPLSMMRVTIILNESLRIYLPVGVIGQRITTKTKRGELILPTGVMLSLPTILVHHDKEIWGKDAIEFKPARFSESISKATKGQVTFFTFGAGPRISIALNFAMIKAKMALDMVLQCFTFDLYPSYTRSPESILTMQPKYGAPLILHLL
ncbi:11-oxo-beta-amyrin 30-oxidase [Capsicum chinense]|nr:11-oxo-beta-amyrin 30-oxidase [Capsicum chinense]